MCAFYDFVKKHLTHICCRVKVAVFSCDWFAYFRRYNYYS